ncbi:MAG: DUF6531 domain-containing protein [Verrucomicrobia bacterium]|nr:DUF6531 domain-containing protein [Verrucomicrobiota bacterium]
MTSIEGSSILTLAVYPLFHSLNNKLISVFMPFLSDRLVGLRGGVFACLLFGNVFSHPATAEPIYFAGTGSYYEFVDAPGLMWEQARDAAKDRMHQVGEKPPENGHLAVITSQSEDVFIRIAIEETGVFTGPWIGADHTGSRPKPDSPPDPISGWSWVTEEDFSDYQGWHENEPNNDPFWVETEDAAHFSGGKWNDVIRTRTDIIGYLVEYEGLDPPPTEDSIADSTANLPNSTTAADPVNTFTGELFTELITDIDLGGPMPLRFEHYYGSYLRRSFILGDLGSNWLHNFDTHLNRSGNSITYVNNRGRVVRFLQNISTGEWVQITQLDTSYQLIADGPGDALLYDPDDEHFYTFDFSTNNLLAGKLIKIEDGKGNVHTLTYDELTGDLQMVSDGLGRRLNFTYNSDAIPKISSVTINGTFLSVMFQYTDAVDSEYLTTVTDTLNGTTTYTYEDTSSGTDHALTLSAMRPAGNIPFTQTFYDASNQFASGRVATQTDGDGNVFDFDYVDNDTTITDPLGNTRVHRNTPTGELSESEDETGQMMSMGSDAVGRRNSLTDRLEATTSFTYHDPSGKLSSVTQADGAVTAFDYASRVVGNVTLYDLTEVTYGDGTTESYAYDAAGNLTAQTDQLGKVETATFNGQGQLLTRVNRVGGANSNTYNADGTMATSIDPAGNQTSFTYDSMKRLNRITHPDFSFSSFNYDNADRVTIQTDENSNTTRFVYDANSNLTYLEDPNGKATAFTYDNNDRLVSVRDPLLGVSSRTYDALGRIATETDENGNTTSFDYDARGRLSSTTDPLGEVWLSTYDDESIIASTTDPLGNTTSFASDEMGRITQVTSPMGEISNLSYDALGRLVSTTDPLNNTTMYKRDARGLVTGITLGGGSIGTSYSRNTLGNITALTDPNGNVWQRSYDVSGRHESSTDPLGNTRTFSYDARNRPSMVTYPGTMGTQSVGFDFGGRLRSRNFSDGTSMTYFYDANDRLTATDNGINLGYDDNDRVNESNGITIERDATGRITSMTLAPDRAITYSYDTNGRLNRVADWVEGISDFSYDAAGRLTTLTRPNGVTTTYSYNKNSRLVGMAEGAISDITLSRDGKGQITSASRNVPLAASTTGLAESVQTYDEASQVSGYDYDVLGRLTSDDTRSYDWDLASRLTGIDESGDVTTYTYDAMGFRLTRTSTAETREYTWNYALGFVSISIEREADADFRYFIHTPGGALLYSINAADNARSFYHFDEIGNTIFITDNSGTVIGSYAYTPFGQLTDFAGELDNLFTWQGEHGVMDEGGGFYYVRSRYYDANTGRFISRDPINTIGPLSSNPYQYAFNNPKFFIDPSGNRAIPWETSNINKYEKFRRLQFKIENLVGIARAKLNRFKSLLREADALRANDCNTAKRIKERVRRLEVETIQILRAKSVKIGQNAWDLPYYGNYETGQVSKTSIFINYHRMRDAIQLDSAAMARAIDNINRSLAIACPKINSVLAKTQTNRESAKKMRPPLEQIRRAQGPSARTMADPSVSIRPGPDDPNPIWVSSDF